ncbi:stage II sporulation protein R [Desulfuribacillus alkaliarsenatis]|uniref:Stage II sporulation protein R n=1 Tax=Desulfuribacillus alkaliarsenatis TaxID=766136 RepID=A0A1E5G1J4_9FIRM|nr:stage II sporulation protein R [Desulfuribacillus alkaliarsenatis]OEF96765.1 stage II sporulation protein R [Desulfuribacillus alkaliarsenatis]
MLTKTQTKLIQYILVLVMILVMSWEQAYSQPLLWKSQELPEDAIRLRVLPNSDRPVDQWLKQNVRDAVTEYMQDLAEDFTSSDQAEQYLQKQIEVVTELVINTIREQGFNYNVNVRLDEAQFPTIKYGEHLYPAGVYKALIIEIGQAAGENWWCVLYPPLCLVDITSATIIDNEEPTSTTGNDLQNIKELKELKELKEQKQIDEVQYKFFLAKLFKR